MKRLLLVVTLCSLLAPSVQAQTNPCDRPAMTGNHVVTSANQTVYVCSRHPNGVPEDRYRSIVSGNPKAKGWDWRVMRRNRSESA